MGREGGTRPVLDKNIGTVSQLFKKGLKKFLSKLNQLMNNCNRELRRILANFNFHCNGKGREKFAAEFAQSIDANS